MTVRFNFYRPMRRGGGVLLLGLWLAGAAQAQALPNTTAASRGVREGAAAAAAARAAGTQAPAPLRIPTAAVAPPTATGNALTLGEALRAARDNLDVSLSRQALRAARADVLAADRAPFPVLSAGLSSIDLQNGVGAGNPLTKKRIDKGIGIDWTYERGNKRALRTRNAERAVTAAFADVDDVQLQQLLATIGAYYDLVGAQERIEQLVEVERSQSQIAISAMRRVKAGDLGRQDALRTEIDAQRVRADQSAALLDRQRASLVLAQLINRVQQPERLRATTDWPKLDAAPAINDPAIAGQLAALVDSRPEVRAAIARVQAAQTNVELQQAQRKADVTWGVSVNSFPGTSNRSLGLRASMPLQWNYDYQGEIGRALAQGAQAQDSLDKTRRDSYSDLLRLQNEVQSAAARARSYDVDILPRAQTVAAGAEFAFGRGAIPLTDLLDARRVLRLTLLEGLTARTDYAKALGAWQLRTRPEAVLPVTTP
ncbi:MAG: TolC family protein [Burkholderiales bacterium]